MTDHSPTIAPRNVTAAAVPGVAETLAGPFHADPIFTWWIADEARRREILPGVFRIVAEANLAGGGLYATDDLLSAAIWSPPGAEDDEEMIMALYRRHGFEVVGEIRLPDGPSLWPMWREAA